MLYPVDKESFEQWRGKLKLGDYELSELNDMYWPHYEVMVIKWMFTTDDDYNRYLNSKFIWLSETERIPNTLVTLSALVLVSRDHLNEIRKMHEELINIYNSP